MLEIRLFEDKAMELYGRGLIPGSIHLCQGHEAVSVGAISAMRSDDYLTVTYRGHGHALARGMPMDTAFAELMGRRAGCSQGVGGSMHLADARRGLVGAFAIVGAGLPVALGAAMAARIQGRDAVAVAFFGDGAVNIGTFHETLNMAAVWEAPIVFICENNLYGQFTPYHRTAPVRHVADRASAYGMPGQIVDGQDVNAVHEAATRMIARARTGGGPALIEAKTYRFRGHSRADPGTYRPKEELLAWMKRDPISLLAERLAGDGSLTATDQERMRADAQREVDEAADRAEEAGFLSIDEARSLVYA